MAISAAAAHQGATQRDQGVRAAAVGVAAAILVFAALANLRTFLFVELTVDQVVSFFGRIFLIALVFERALEVMITTWRGPQAVSLSSRVDAAAARLRSLAAPARPAPPAPAEQDAAVAEAAAADGALAEYRATTQRIALWTAFVLGISLSAVGVRILDPLLQAGSAAGIQRAVFVFLDALLSGAAIAGGSEGIHKITQAFQDFFEASSKRARGAAAP